MGLIRIQQAAQMTGVNRQTIMNWCKSGIIPCKQDSGIYYVWSETIEALKDTMNDVEDARKRLKEEADALRKEHDAYHSEIMAYRDDRYDRRIKSVVVANGIHTRFFDAMVGIMGYADILTERETAVLTARLHGVSYEKLMKEYGMTRECIRMITEKAVRKAIDLDNVKKRLNKVDELEKDNAIMRKAIESLKNENERLNGLMELRCVVNKREAEELEEAGLHVDQRLIDILNTKLVDACLSVRALTCLKGKDIETVGDLVKMNRSDILKFRNMGKKTLRELTEFLESLNLSFSMDVDKIYRVYINKLHDDAVS